MEIHHFSHQHPLTSCDKDLFDTDCFDDGEPCFGCRQEISFPTYRCAESCSFFIHKSCAELPLEIKHSLHQQHPLTLLSKPPNDSRECHACGDDWAGFFFHCSDCQFQLDVNCASLMPTKNHEDHEHQIQHLGKTHPLILCAMNKNFNLSCSACRLPFEDSIYVCIECKLLLHKSCGKFPLEIKHPFHPEHPLTLLPRAPSNCGNCSVCGQRCYGFTYQCDRKVKKERTWSRDNCGFCMHANCASLVPNIMSELHEHPLAFITTAIEHDFFVCSYCRSFISTSVFRCVDCNFNLHLHCNTTVLPHIIKHKFHRHTLTLTNSHIKDYSDEDEDEDEEAKYYCDACEERRSLTNCSYHCAKCNLIAHVHCALSEVRLHSGFLVYL